MNHIECSICKNIEDNYYYPHDHDEIYSPFFEKMNPVGVRQGDEKYHARFLKCPICGTYYFYENRQQGIGNIGEFDQIDRFSENENKILKPILEAQDALKLRKAVLKGIEFENGILAEKTQIAFETVINILPFSTIFPAIERFISYKKKWSTPDGIPVNQGRYWACTLLRGAIRNATALPEPEVHKAIYKCFGIEIDYKEGVSKTDGWQAPDDLPICSVQVDKKHEK